MMFSSHILYVQEAAVVINDDYGQPIAVNEASWREVGPCRCDHVGEKEIRLPDGSIGHSDYHIVVSTSQHGIHIGDIVRCEPVPHSNGTVCTGKAIRVKNLNFLNYAEIDI